MTPEEIRVEILAGQARATAMARAAEEMCGVDDASAIAALMGGIMVLASKLESAEVAVVAIGAVVVAIGAVIHGLSMARAVIAISGVQPATPATTGTSS